MGSTFPECPSYPVPITEWELIKDYSLAGDDEFLVDLDDLPVTVSILKSAHIDIDIVVMLLFEGKDLTPDMHDHLLTCAQCRHAMVATVSDELLRWRHTRRCSVRDDLFREWRGAVEMYAESLSDLTGKTGRVADLELFKIAKITETARKLTAQFRAELDEHIATHGC